MFSRTGRFDAQYASSSGWASVSARKSSARGYLRLRPPSIRLLNQTVTNFVSGIPPWNASSRYKSVTPSHGTIEHRWGGLRAATHHCDIAKYETPTMPTNPVHHGWDAAHSMRS